MARIRTIKPSFFKNEGLAELPAVARLLFIGLWTLSDKEGRLEDRPKRIKAELFPYDNVEVDQQLSRLQSAGFIVRYEVGELKVIQIINFSKHQRITGTEAESTSELPECDDIVLKETMRKQRGNNADDRKGLEGKGYKERSMVPPTIEEVREYVKSKGYDQVLADKVFEYYSTADWKDSKGNKVKNWKQKLISVWFKDDHKLKTNEFNLSKAVEAIKAGR